MKLLLSALITLVTFSAFAQTPSPAPIKFDPASYNFGRIKQNIPVTTTFTFTNISDKKILIESAQPSCGCTASDYTKTPVDPGKTGTIKVTYNAAAPGKFNKPVTVKLANVNETIMIFIEGEVEAAAQK